jgi:flagellar protein FlaJ
MDIDPVKIYMRICYSLLGRYLDIVNIPSVATMLYQADMEMTAGMFVSMAIVTAILAGIPMFFFTFFILQDPVYILILTILAVVVVGAGFPFVVYNQISNKKMGIDKELPFALAYMSILSSAGSTPLDILRRMSLENYGEVSKEFRKVIYRVDILGEDEVTAMNDLANNTPSEIFRGIVVDIANIMYSGSGMKEYLESKSKDLLDIKRQAQKEFVDSLAVYGEGYLGGILTMVIMAVVGIVVAGAMDIPLGPFSSSEAFQLLVYLIIPLINVIFYLLLEQKYSGAP